MKRLRWHPMAVATAALVVTMACGDDGGPAVPVPGTLVASLTTPNADDGAILFSISGGGISTPTAVSSSHVLFFLSTSASSMNIVVAGNIAAGPLVRFSVPDVGQASSYIGTITEVADRNNGLRAAVSGYRLQFAQEAGS